MKLHSQSGESVSLSNLGEIQDQDNTDIRAEIARFKALNKEKDEEYNEEFPINALPEPIQNIVREGEEKVHFPPEFTAPGMLYTASEAIGNSLSIQVKQSWTLTPMLYMAVVGRPGTNKSHPLEWALKPIRNKDAQSYATYQDSKKEYDKSLKDKGSDVLEKPKWAKHIVSDATIEALAAVHQNNPRGIGLFVDELAGWFMNFGRYNRGTDQEFFLSAWNGNPITTDRKSSDPVYIPKPFISICGGIQPSVLPKLGQGGRSENGFLDRILFVYPPDLKKPKFSQAEMDPGTAELWNTIIERLLKINMDLDVTGNPNPKVIQMSPEAKKLYKIWYNQNAERIHNSTDQIAGILTKFDTHIPRLALIIEALGWACGECRDIDLIRPESMERAIRLAKYFEQSAIRVHAKISGNVLDRLPTNKRAFYEMLPAVFETAAAIKIGEECEISEPTVNRFLTEKSYFNHMKQGWYSKIIT